MNRAMLAIGILLLSSAFVTAADDLPTPEQLKQLETDKNWVELLKGTTKALALKGPAAEKFNRAELWIQKAEAQLQQKQFIPASESFKNAAEEKTVAPEIADTCTAMSALVRKSDARGYRVPQTKDNPSPPAFDIFDPATRTDAMKALFDSEYTDLKKDLDKAKTKPALPELIKIAKQAKPLPTLERAATKTDEQSKQLVADVGTQASETIGKWVESSRTQIDKIRESANRMIRVKAREIPGQTVSGHTLQKAGLSGQDRSDLQGIMKECEKIAGLYKQYIDAVGEARDAMVDVPKRVENVFEEAKNVLNANYTGIYKK